jgi:MscS family membrane protein
MLGLGHDQLFSLLQLIHGYYQWAFQILIVLIVAYIAYVSVKKLHAKFLPKAKASPKIWDDALIEAAYRPVIWLIKLLASLLILEIIHFELMKIPFFEKFTLVFQSIVVVIFMVFFLNFGKKFELTYVEKRTGDAHIDRTTMRAIFNLYQVFVITLSVLTLLQVFGIPLSGVIAFGGIGGIAVGFAAKDLLANFFGGLMIFLDRPFAIGDWIRSPDREIEGHVEHIGWRQVQIRNFEQRPIYIPNSLFSTIIIENPSRMRHRRIKQTFGIRFEDIDKVSLITRAIENYLKNHAEIDTNKHILVALINPGSYSLDILIEAFTKAVNKVHFYQVQHAVFVQILSIIESFGAQSPYPTQNIILENSQAVPNHVENKLQ